MDYYLTERKPFKTYTTRNGKEERDKCIYFEKELSWKMQYLIATGVE